MNNWNPQHYRFHGERQGVAPVVLDHAIAVVDKIRAANPNTAPILTLRHLSEATQVDYGFLRNVVARNLHPYKVFTLKKVVPGRSRTRMICTPLGDLRQVQDWIVQNILRHTRAHATSYAYHPHSRPEFAARIHCGCDWLLKVDVEDFFHRVSEGRVFRIFRDLGYPDLLSFELARLTTVAADNGRPQREAAAARWPEITAYHAPFEGFLPQGAPTSPMLSNLAMTDLDERFSQMAAASDLKYTRYADDLAFSARKPHTRTSMLKIRRKVIRTLNEAGFKANLRKTAIRGPGARRIVLGLLVDGKEPRLSREFKDDLRLHLHYLTADGFGPSRHAEARGVSISGLYHRVRGLIGWALRVEPDYGETCLKAFASVKWPPIDMRLPSTSKLDDYLKRERTW